MDINNFPIPSATVASQKAQILAALGLSATPLNDYLYGPGRTSPFALQIASLEVTPDVATNGRVQTLVYNAQISSFNIPTGLGNGQTLFVQIYRPNAVGTFSFHADYRFMDGATAAELSDIASSKFAFLSVTRADTVYLASINIEK